LLRTQLTGVQPWDPPSYTIASAVLMVAALVASWIPAVRATRVNPLEALRAE
jgi:ABC-type lipoprotein release transport system permease subunit